MRKNAPIGTVHFANQTMKLADGLLHWNKQAPTIYEVAQDSDGLHYVAEVDLADVLADGDTGVPEWYDENGDTINLANCYCRKPNAHRAADLANNSVVINGGKRVFVGDIVFRVMKGQIKQELIYRHNGVLKAVNPDAVRYRKVDGKYRYMPLFSTGLGAGVVIKTDDSEALTLGHVSKMYRTYQEAAKVAGFDPEMSSVRNGRLQGVTLYCHGKREALTFAEVVGEVEVTKRLSAA